MQPWQQRTLTYSLFLVVASTLIGVKYHIPFFIELASAVGFENALVDETATVGVDPFKTPSFLALKAKAETGDAEACLSVARQYKLSVGGDITLANQWYIKAAEAGQSHAQFYVGAHYSEGTEGLPKDMEKAIYWSEKAAEQGVALAQFNTGNMYDYQEKNYKKAVYWYEKAVAQGTPEAMANLAVLYTEGKGVGKNPKKAVELRKESADLGIKEAQYKLGYDYLTSENGVTYNYPLAKHYLELAAQQGMPDAQYCMGWIYDYALGVEPNAQVAEEWYQKAIMQGSTEAQTAMAALLKTGVHGIATDLNKVKEFKQLLEKAQKTNAPEDQFAVGEAYGWGKGVVRDDKEALKWFEKSAKQGYVKAIGTLGDYWYDAWDGTTDFTKALTFYEQAALKGEKYNQNRLGYMYDIGQGTSIDKKKAFYWYEKAAKQGYDCAQVNLGIQYEYGEGIGTNKEQALEVTE